MDVEYLKCVADDEGYKIVYHKEREKVIRIKRDVKMIDIWYTTGTIGIHTGENNQYGYGKVDYFKKLGVLEIINKIKEK